MVVNINGNPVCVSDKETYYDLCARLDILRCALCVMVRGETLSLNEKVREADAHVVTYLDEEGRRVYERSIRFVLLMAFEKLYPGAFVRIEHSIWRGIYVTVRGMKLTEDVILRLKNEMKNITSLDLPFTLLNMSRKEAISHYEARGDEDKVKILRYRPFEHFRMYECGGMKEYFYGEMARSTGCVSVFDVIGVGSGLAVLLPDHEDPLRVSEYRPMPKLLSVFRESARWHEILDVETAADLNEMTEKGRLREFIRVNEALMDRKIYEIADKIVESRARLVCIAGPSSSGKTTFCNRLMIALRVTGLTPVKLSLDDYYLNRDQAPLDEHGEVDLECVESLDTELIGKHLTQLLDGEKVDVPVYDFTTGTRTDKTYPMRVDSTSPILIEGIHGLNDRLTPGLAREMKFKIYISALTTINIDHHNRIRTTDARLIRRIVRDAAFRGTDPEMTFSMWPSVRRGEDKNIFPFQEDADAMINSSLAYELAILKNYAYPILTAITPDNVHYTAARRLVKFLNYIRSADVEDEVPLNSILREFIGGSCFYREDLEEK